MKILDVVQIIRTIEKMSFLNARRLEASTLTIDVNDCSACVVLISHHAFF